MAVFWILAVLMTVAALAFVLVPLLRARVRNAPSRVEANLEILRGQRREIDADVAYGLLPAEARDEALSELMNRADSDLQPVPGTSAPAGSRPWVLAACAGIAIPALAFGIYAFTGNPMAADDRTVTALADPKPNDPSIIAMVEGLAKKVKSRPDDAQGWALLGRSMSALGRFQESADAYAQLVRLAPNDAQVLADYADSLAMTQGKTLIGKPHELALKALEIEPGNAKALALAGTASLDLGEFDSALKHWQKLASVLPPESPDQAQVQSILQEIRSRAAAAGKPVVEAPPVRVAAAPVAKDGAKPEAGGDGKSITGQVSLAFGVSGHVTGGETLFIFARSEGGPRVPLAVIRASSRELPLKFALDDSQAMSPTVKLSGAQAVRIEARISKSGNAMPQPGDLVGSSSVVRPGARNVSVIVDKVLP